MPSNFALQFFSVKKQQIILACAGLALVLALFFFGNTIPPAKPAAPVESATANTSNAGLDQILQEAKKGLTTLQLGYLVQLENSVVRGDVKDQQITIYKQLSSFWDDSLRHHILGAFYLGEAAKLENSEKNLNFAARLMLGHLLAQANPAMGNWLATDIKALYEQSLKINPANDSARIGIGACYLFGNISSSPMEGINMIRKVAEEKPENAYAQLMLGLGSVRSGQYDKAVERFMAVLKLQPASLEAAFNLAEVYERKGDNKNAVIWYRKVQQLVQLPEVKSELEKRIKTLE